MGEIKKQLKFAPADEAEYFFDCPMSTDQYIEMLVENETITV